MHLPSIAGYGDAKTALAAIDKSLAIFEFDLTGKILKANANFCRDGLRKTNASIPVSIPASDSPPARLASHRR